MKHIRWQALIALTGIAFLGVVFAVLAFGASTVERADYGGTYVEGVAGRPNALNPIFSQYNEVDRDIAALVFSGLTRADENGNIKPDLATKWSIAPSGLIYTFTLRSDVYWHDGEHFDADDVLYTLHTIQDPACKCPPDLAGFWRTVAISALDATTIRFQLTQPYAPFLDYTRIGILPAHLLKEVAPGDLLQHLFNRKPIGTGAFQIAELTAQHVLLDANPRYYGARPYLGRVQLKFYPDFETIFAAYAREEVSGIARILPGYLKKAQEQPQLKLYNARIGGYALVLFNLSKFQFQDKNVRQALLYATDRKRLIDEQLQGQGVIASSPIEPGSWAHNALINPYAFDLDKAKALLDGAGWRDSDGDGTRDKDRQQLAFALTTSDDPQRVAIANALAKNWQMLGVKVTVQAVPASLLVQNILRPRQFDAVLYEWRTLSNDPDQYENWHETQIPDAARAGQNYAGLKDRDISETLEAARRTSDLGKRAELYRKFQELFADRVPALLLYYPIYSYGIDARVRDVQLAPLLTPSDRFRSIAQWYLKTKRVPPDATEEPTRTRIIPTSAPMTATPPITAAPTVSGAATPLVVVVVATPAPASTVDAGQCAASSAIKSPGMDVKVSGLYEIRGTATHPNLGYWKLELRADATPTYTQLFRSDQPVNDQVLSVWSTRTVPNGVYWLQLVVVDSAGNAGTPCQIRVNVAN
jgi:peptide/nickel transport system substrate-binding protein